nr:uncharacterized protein LOC104119047 [Nicotiana tomentosiformis]
MSQLEPQQPVQVYPNNPNNFPNQANNIPTQSSSSSSSSHSNGSFVSVFVVLAIVLVISLIACVVGRLCSKKSHGPKVKKSNGHPQKQKEGKQKHNEFHQRGQGDIEFGFDKRIASSKVAAAHGDHYKGSKPFKNIAGKGGVRFADDHIDFKPGP